LHPEWLAVLSFLCLVFIGLTYAFRQSFSGILGYSSSITADQVVDATNAERAQVGAKPLRLNTVLSSAARAKGQDMLSEQYWAHTSPSGKQPWDFMKQEKYTFVVAGENLARDFSTTDAMVNAWMASPTHKANIINTRYEEIGVAVIDGTFQGVETTLVVQMFGTPPKSVGLVGDAGTTQEPVQAVEVEPANNELDTQSVPRQVVLASAAFPQSGLSMPPLFSPLQLSKAALLAVVLMLICTLIYDTVLIHNRDTMRLVGNNIGHITFLLVVAFLVIYFRGGIIH
jgi:uncharacterized protein YkwD